MYWNSAGTQTRAKKSLWECWGFSCLLHLSVLWEAEVKQNLFVLLMVEVSQNNNSKMWDSNTQLHHIKDPDRVWEEWAKANSHCLKNNKYKEQSMVEQQSRELGIAAVSRIPMEPFSPLVSQANVFQSSLGFCPVLNAFQLRKCQAL